MYLSWIACPANGKVLCRIFLGPHKKSKFSPEAHQFIISTWSLFLENISNICFDLVAIFCRNTGWCTDRCKTTLTGVIILKHNVSRLILLIVWFVSGAVKCNNLLDKLSIDTETEEMLKLWFQYAGNQDGGCYYRRSKTLSHTREEQQDETSTCLDWSLWSPFHSWTYLMFLMAYD